MPRIRNSKSDPIDYCKRDFPSEKSATFLYNDVGEGPDGRGNCFVYDDEHPPYEGEDYRCFRCAKLLTVNDNEKRVS